VGITFTIFRKALPSVVSGYGKRSINLNKVVANFEKHTFLSQTDLIRTGIISNCYNEMFENKKIKYNKILTYILRSIFLEIPHLEFPR
jgi:hypothetical protein